MSMNIRELNKSLANGILNAFGMDIKHVTAVQLTIAVGQWPTLTVSQYSTDPETGQKINQILTKGYKLTELASESAGKVVQ